MKGIILGAKIYVDFGTFDIDECMRRLKIELRALNILPYQVETKDDNSFALEPCTPAEATEEPDTLATSSVETEEQVNEWLAANGIHQSIVSRIVPCDGRLLAEIYLMRLVSPGAFFHNMLAVDLVTTPNDDGHIDKSAVPSLRDIAHFSLQLSNKFASSSSSISSVNGGY